MPTNTPAPSTFVIGGGPGGLMAAQVLAEAGCRVTLVDRMRSPGRKFLLAGRSGLNLTNAEPLDAFVARYGAASSKLEAALRSFDPAALRQWALALGEDTYIGSSGRVFPDSWRATPLLRAWIERLTSLGVQFLLQQRFAGWEVLENGLPDPRRIRFVGPDGSTSVQQPDATVLALGGGSWPRSGSDGGWVPILRSAGIAVRDLLPANAGLTVAWSAHLLDRFEGTPLKNVSLTHCGVTVRGDAMITRQGLEGLPVYAHTASVRNELLTTGTATVQIDLHPDLGYDEVARRLTRRRPRDSWSNGIRRSLGLSPAAIAVLREATDNSPPNDPRAIADLVKAAPLAITGTAGLERAISSSGGIPLEAVDHRFMLTALPGVFVAGEMLDWDAPTGGYLLQATFATAVAAARGALHWATMAP